MHIHTHCHQPVAPSACIYSGCLLFETEPRDSLPMGAMLRTQCPVSSVGRRIGGQCSAVQCSAVQCNLPKVQPYWFNGKDHCVKQHLDCILIQDAFNSVSALKEPILRGVE